MIAPKIEGRLYLFNLSLDKDNLVLRNNTIWAKLLSSYFTETTVITTHKGKGTFSDFEYKVIELGGGTFVLRIRALLTLFLILLNILFNKKRATVFYHMTTIPAAFVSPVLRLFKIKQGLWYSHQSATWMLRISTKFVNVCFSPTENTFPLKTRKLIPVGHGIEPYKKTGEVDCANTTNSIAVVGRIARIKRIENLLHACSKVRKENVEIKLVGPLNDPEYLREVIVLAYKLEVNISYLGELSFFDLLNSAEEYNMIFSGTVGSVDKAPLEFMSIGVPIVTSNRDLIGISGMSEFWHRNFSEELSEKSIEAQVNQLLSTSLTRSKRQELIELVREKNNLDRLIQTIVKNL